MRALKKKVSHGFHSLVHHVGMACRTRAATARVHRLRVGPFTLKDALLYTEWNVNCLENVDRNGKMWDEVERDMVESGGMTVSREGNGR